MRPLEPEIIPPGQELPPRDRSRVRVWVELGEGRRIPVGQPALAAVGLAAGLVLLALAGTVVLLGAVFLVWLPVIGLIAAAAVVLRLLGVGRPRAGLRHRG